jgi:hypothetical protein
VKGQLFILEEDLFNYLIVIFLLYSFEISFIQIYSHILNALPPLPLTPAQANEAYRAPENPQRRRRHEDEDDEDDDDNEDEGGGEAPPVLGAAAHPGFRAECYSCFLGQLGGFGAAVHFKEELEATSLVGRATMALAAQRSVDALFAGKATSGSAAERPPLCAVAVRCVGDLVGLAATHNRGGGGEDGQQVNLAPSIRRTLSQFSTSLGYPAHDPGSLLRDPPVLVAVLRRWLLDERRSLNELPFWLFNVPPPPATAAGKRVGSELGGGGGGGGERQAPVMDRALHCTPGGKRSNSNEMAFGESESGEGCCFGTLDDEEDGFSSCSPTSPDSSESRGALLCRFVRWANPWLVPVLCCLPSATRYKTLEGCAELLGFGSSDAGLQVRRGRLV